MKEAVLQPIRSQTNLCLAYSRTAGFWKKIHHITSDFHPSPHLLICVGTCTHPTHTHTALRSATSLASLVTVGVFVIDVGEMVP